MKLLLFGLTWRATSPSSYTLEASPGVRMYFNGDHWRVAFDGEDGPAVFTSRDHAAYAIAEGVDAWMWEQMA